MFKKEKEANINPDATDTVIGESSRIEGNITTKASLRIEGQVVGDIETEGDVTIGKKGAANSRITARNVLNAGTIRGSVTTKGELTITETGKMYGDIHVASLNIVSGGQFHGTSEMSSIEDRLADAAKTDDTGVKPANKAEEEKHERPHLHKVEGRKNDKHGKKAAFEQKKAAR